MTQPLEIDITKWNEARLIPTTGIGGAVEQENRATSALLAVMVAVKEYSFALLKDFKAPSGDIKAFIRPRFDLDDRKVEPDGLIQIRRGSRVWTALVEVKTGENLLAAPQLEDYLSVAKNYSFDCVITISNEIPAVMGQHPTAVDGRKTRFIPLHHISWSEVLQTAIIQKDFKGIKDPDQAWILSELIRYLEFEGSGALSFNDMGSKWVGVRESVEEGTLRVRDKDSEEVAYRFDALLRYAAIRLGSQIGIDVIPVTSRQELANPTLRTQAVAAELAKTGHLTGALKIPIRLEL